MMGTTRISEDDKDGEENVRVDIISIRELFFYVADEARRCCYHMKADFDGLSRVPRYYVCFVFRDQSTIVDFFNAPFILSFQILR